MQIVWYLDLVLDGDLNSFFFLFFGIYAALLQGLPYLLDIHWIFIYDAAVSLEQPVGLQHRLTLTDFCQKCGEELAASIQGR